MRVNGRDPRKNGHNANGAEGCTKSPDVRLVLPREMTRVRRTRGEISPKTAKTVPASGTAVSKPLNRRRAASDDASGAPAATAATHHAAGPDRNASAEVAHTKTPRVPSEANANPMAVSLKIERSKEVKPGEAPLPDDCAAFVDEVHLRVDFLEIARALLNSNDEKIRQRALERFLEMEYAHSGAAQEPQTIVIDVPRPIRD